MLTPTVLTPTVLTRAHADIHRLQSAASTTFGWSANETVSSQVGGGVRGDIGTMVMRPSPLRSIDPTFKCARFRTCLLLVASAALNICGRSGGVADVLMLRGH
jgi:hypothetical protein